MADSDSALTWRQRREGVARGRIRDWLTILVLGPYEDEQGRVRQFELLTHEQCFRGMFAGMRVRLRFASPILTSSVPPDVDIVFCHLMSDVAFLDRCVELIRPTSKPLYAMSVDVPPDETVVRSVATAFDHFFIRTRADFALMVPIVGRENVTWWPDVMFGLPARARELIRFAFPLRPRTLGACVDLHVLRSQDRSVRFTLARSLTRAAVRMRCRVCLMGFGRRSADAALDASNLFDVARIASVEFGVPTYAIPRMASIAHARWTLRFMTAAVVMTYHSLVFAAQESLPLFALYPAPHLALAKLVRDISLAPAFRREMRATDDPSYGDDIPSGDALADALQTYVAAYDNRTLVRVFGLTAQGMLDSYVYKRRTVPVEEVVGLPSASDEALADPSDVRDERALSAADAWIASQSSASASSSAPSGYAQDLRVGVMLPAAAEAMTAPDNTTSTTTAASASAPSPDEVRRRWNADVALADIFPHSDDLFAVARVIWLAATRVLDLTNLYVARLAGSAHAKTELARMVSEEKQRRASEDSVLRDMLARPGLDARALSIDINVQQLLAPVSFEVADAERGRARTTALIKYGLNYLSPAMRGRDPNLALALDPHVEHTFLEHPGALRLVGILPYARAWCGILRDTLPAAEMDALMNEQTFTESLRSCVALFTFSPDVARRASRRVSPVPVFVTESPPFVLASAATDPPLFSLLDFFRSSQRQRRIVQAAEPLRQPYTIYDVPTFASGFVNAKTVSVYTGHSPGGFTDDEFTEFLRNFQKRASAALSGGGGDGGSGAAGTASPLVVSRRMSISPPSSSWWCRSTEAGAALRYIVHHLRETRASAEVARFAWQPPEQFFQKNAFLLDVQPDAQVSLTPEIVMRARMHACPLFVRRTPAIEKSLGQSYPGFFRSRPELARMIADPRAYVRTHRYLRARRDLYALSLERYIASFHADLVAVN